jgi:uncharacterized protein (DUF2132 family)
VAYHPVSARYTKKFTVQSLNRVSHPDFVLDPILRHSRADLTFKACMISSTDNCPRIINKTTKVLKIMTRLSDLSTTFVVWWSEFLATVTEVPGSIPGHARFSE